MTVCYSMLYGNIVHCCLYIGFWWELGFLWLNTDSQFLGFQDSHAWFLILGFPQFLEFLYTMSFAGSMGKFPWFPYISHGSTGSRVPLGYFGCASSFWITLVTWVSVVPMAWFCWFLGCLWFLGSMILSTGSLSSTSSLGSYVLLVHMVPYVLLAPWFHRFLVGSNSFLSKVPRILLGFV